MTQDEFDAVCKAVMALQKVVEGLASKQQLKQLSLLKQQEVEEIKARLTTIEEQLTILQRA